MTTSSGHLEGPTSGGPHPPITFNYCFWFMWLLSPVHGPSLSFQTTERKVNSHSNPRGLAACHSPRNPSPCRGHPAENPNLEACSPYPSSDVWPGRPQIRYTHQNSRSNRPAMCVQQEATRGNAIPEPSIHAGTFYSAPSDSLEYVCLMECH